MRKTVFSDSKFMSTTFQKAKSCPQPAEKQKWYYNPQKTKASICFREQKKGSPLPRVSDDPGSQKSLKTRLFQPSLMYFSTSKLPSQ